MFKNVGAELKTWAQIFFVLGLLFFAVLGVAAFVMLYAMDLTVVGGLSFILIVCIGYLISRASTILLYAFGELVDSVQIIKRRLPREDRMI